MPPRALRRAMMVHFLHNAGASSAGLFVPLVAHGLGASDFAVGLIGACFGGAYFVSAWVAGRAADMGRRRHVIWAGLWASALAAPLHALAGDPAQLALARGLFGFALGIAPAALIAYAYDAQRRPGRFAGWGALGWGMGTVAAGVLGANREVFALAAATLLASYLVALALPPRPEVRVRVPWVPREVIRANLPAYLAMLTRHTGAAAVWIVFPLYLVQLGATPLAIGLVYFLNTGCQFLFMGFLDRYRPAPLVVAGLASSSAVFVLFWASPSWEWVLPVQLLLALSWALLYVGSLAWVMERNVERATSTGLLHSTQSLANLLGPVLGGAVAQAAGYPATMLVAAAMSLAGVPLFLRAAAGVMAAERRSAAEVVAPGAAGPAAAPPGAGPGLAPGK